MCTVTIFYSGGDDFVLTSNRDEAPDRISLAPDFYNMNDTEILFPKDEQSGGTWIGVSSKNRTICLLNGGYKLHKRELEYRQSRGVVVKDLLSMKNIDDAQKYDFSNIEPFTIVVADWNAGLKFYEIVWDGNEAYYSKLPLTNHIWSSSTLYNEEKKQVRRDWFEAFKSENKLTSKSLLEFHQTAGKGNDDFGVVMNRGFVKTTSITQIEKINNVVAVCFQNLNTAETTTKTFNLVQTINE